MEDYNFYQVQGWMVNNLKLRGNELICYAIIYSFSQDDESKFMGGINYLQGWMNCSKPTVIDILDKLKEKGLIEAITVISKTGKRVYYQVTKDSLLGGRLRNLTKVGKEPLPSLYNNNNNNINNKLKDYSDCSYSNNNPSNPKAQDEELDFEQSFYKLYPLKKGKPCAERAWKKLSHRDRQAAIDKLPAYIDDCVTNKRSFKYPATYLNQRTWEDDFGTRQKISFYDPLDSDSDEKKRFKEWMRNNHPEIENTALPLSYEDYMELVGKNYERVYLINAILDEIDREIWKYRKSDIATVIRQEVRKEEADD